VYRSNASLLAVVQRYAPGIQYCYGNELKHDPSLRGKLVVALTVAASGEVTHANIVQNSTGSSRLAACALDQIRDWRFPAIATGSTTFQAPFVIFEIATSTIQAFVFTLLSTVYIAMMMPHGDHEKHHSTAEIH